MHIVFCHEGFMTRHGRHKRLVLRTNTLYCCMILYGVVGWQKHCAVLYTEVWFETCKCIIFAHDKHCKCIHTFVPSSQYYKRTEVHSLLKWWSTDMSHREVHGSITFASPSHLANGDKRQTAMQVLETNLRPSRNRNCTLHKWFNMLHALSWPCVQSSSHVVPDKSAQHLRTSATFASHVEGFSKQVGLSSSSVINCVAQTLWTKHTRAHVSYARFLLAWDEMRWVVSCCPEINMFILPAAAAFS